MRSNKPFFNTVRDRAVLPLGLACAVGVLLFSLSLSAETTDFGGSGDKFKGIGDREPPRCQINVPRAATSPFFIAWNCVDDAAAPDEITSELWIQRKDSPIFRKVVDFLGFPASVLVDEAILQSMTVGDGLPASFRLLARDRAGIAALSPVLTVVNQDNSVETCDLRITTEATPATGGTTGVPSLTVFVDDAEVTTQQTGNDDVQIANIIDLSPSPCEIDALCDADGENELRFSAALSEQQTGMLSGSLNINSGDLIVAITGSGQLEDSILSSFEVSGTTVIDGAPADVVLSCRQ